MQTLRALLRSIANIQLILQEMQNRAAANAISKHIKTASAMFSIDFNDVADLVDEGLEYDDLCLADVERLRAVSHNLRNCNQHLHLVQNLILSA